MSASTPITTPSRRWPIRWPPCARGARQIQGTLNGLGERCGNANLCSLIPTLRLKNEFSDAFDIGVTAEKMATLMKVSRTLDDMLNRARRTAMLLTSAKAPSSTKTGIHAPRCMKDPQTYEHVSPESVGNSPQGAGLRSRPGRSNVMAELDRAGIAYEKSDPKLARLVEELKEREAAGYAYESANASFDLLARRTLGQRAGIFQGRAVRRQCRSSATTPTASASRWRWRW